LTELDDIDETQIGSRIRVSSQLARWTTNWPCHRKFFRKLLRARHPK